ncbi:MAG TPA: phosphatidylcholine/phosphatidylserine synthase [Pyrinomonadaceae bacterium]
MSATELPVEEPQTETVNPERRGIKKGLYLVPSAFTAANIGLGFYAVMAALRGFQLVGGGTEAELARAAVLFDHASIAIGGAVVCDALDGRIARMTKTTTEIGVQFDSIADVLTFGIAPAVLAYAWGVGSALKDGSASHKLGWFISFMYLMCGAFRLARFNVQATRPRLLAEGTVKVDKKSFIGLPIPAAAAMIAAIIHFAPKSLMQYGVRLGAIYSDLMIALVGFLAVLMVSTLRYSSFKSVGTGRRSPRLTILAVALGMMLILLYSRYVLLAVVTAYVLHGLLFKFWSLLRPRPHAEHEES